MSTTGTGTAGAPSSTGASTPPGSQERGRAVTPRHRQVLAVAWALIALQALVRGWMCLRGFFYIDDFAFTGKVMEHGLTDPDLLLEPYNSHLMPGSYVWVWLTTHAFPLQWAPVAIVATLLQLVLAVLVLALLREMFGTRPLILLPLAIALFSPISLPAFLWWAASMNQLPQQIALVGMLWLHVRGIRSGRTRTAQLGAAFLLLGLLFSERTLLALAFLVAFHVLVLATGGPAARLRSALLDHRRVWAAYAAVAIPYAIAYAVIVPSPVRQARDLGAVLTLIWNSIAQGTVTGLLGGPWSWERVGFAGGVVAPSAFALMLALLVAVAVVALTCWWHRGAWAPWTLLLGYALVNSLLLGLTRGTVVGATVGREYRYQTELGIIGAVCLGLAIMPLLRRADRDPDPLPVRDSARVQADQAFEALGTTRSALPAEHVVAGVLTALLLASSLWSSWAYDRIWSTNPAKTYLAHAREQARLLPRDARLADVPVPEPVAWSFLGRYSRAPQVLAPLQLGDVFLRQGQASTDVYQLDEQGFLRKTVVRGTPVRPGTRKSCAWAVMPGTTAKLPMSQLVAPGPLMVRIGYLASQDSTVTVRTGTVSGTTTVRRGLGALYLQGRGPLADIEVTVAPGGGVLCADDTSAGFAVPLAGSGPPATSGGTR